ncbi:hypothetical protein IAU60_004846 [Kwoniella sp. DSM 27419]
MLAAIRNLSLLALLGGVVASPTPAGIKASELSRRTEATNVQFINDWPDQFVGGESYHMSWNGSQSGKYTFAWVEEYNGGQDLLLNFVFQDETYDQYDFYFAPAKCWKPDSSFRFIVYDSQGFPLPEDRAYGPKIDLVAGSDEAGVC